MNPLRVLIADNEPLVVRTLTDILLLKGCQAEGVYSGEEAIAAVQRCPYEIVLMDIRMPGLSGIEAFRAIRCLSPQTRVIFITAYMDSEPVAEIEQEGGVRILPKPVDIEELLALLESLSV